MKFRALLFCAFVATLFQASTLGLLGGACAHVDPGETQLHQQRLDSVRASIQGHHDVESAIEWSDAVSAALKAGIVVDEGDMTDAMTRLRAAQAAAFGADVEPIASARARLFAAAGRQVDADAAWVESARAAPAPANLDGLFAAAERNRDKPRLRALCAVGPVALPTDALAAWLDRCAWASGIDKSSASALWLAADRTRLQTGRDSSAETSLDKCLLRCRPALYRAVAACPGGDNRCLELASHAFDVCETNCREMP